MATSTPFNITPNHIKRVIARAFDLLGINSLGFAVQNAFFSPFVRVVNYHEIRSGEEELFEAHLRYYKENYSSIDLPILETFLETGHWEYPRPGLILSFDDGHLSHYEIAAPLLEKHDLTGWFFIPIGLMDLGDEAGAKIGRDGEPRSNVLTAAQLKYLDANHVVGSHTETHCRLRETVPLERLDAEITGSQNRLESLLGHAITTFCWVGGEEDTYSRQAANLIKKAYKYGFMTNNALNAATVNPLQIQRTNIEAENPLWLVRFQLSGLMDLFYANKRRRVNRLTA